MRSTSLALLIAVVSPVAFAADPAPFFDGKSLAGWEGLPQYWKVVDGAIVGSTMPDGLRGNNTFLCSTRKYKDFEMSFQVRLTGVPQANSGVQIRSEVADKAKFIVKGPQCDMGQQYWGSLYGEGFGGMMRQSPPAKVKQAVKPNEFNDYSIKCIGKHVTIKINGETMVDEDFQKLPDEGIIALQLHQTPPPGMEATFRKIEFKEIK
jgi:hypothetical protein